MIVKIWHPMIFKKKKFPQKILKSPSFFWYDNDSGHKGPFRVTQPIYVLGNKKLRQMGRSDWKYRFAPQVQNKSGFLSWTKKLPRLLDT